MVSLSSSGHCVRVHTAIAARQHPPNQGPAAQNVRHEPLSVAHAETYEFAALTRLLADLKNEGEMSVIRRSHLLQLSPR